MRSRKAYAVTPLRELIMAKKKAKAPGKAIDKAVEKALQKAANKKVVAQAVEKVIKRVAKDEAVRKAVTDAAKVRSGTTGRFVTKRIAKKAGGGWPGSPRREAKCGPGPGH